MCRFILFFSVILILLASSCHRSNSSKQITKAVTIDTLSVLTANNWQLMEVWYDSNNNGKIDSGELINFSHIFTLYSFQVNYIIKDTTIMTSNTGIWSFAGATKDTIKVIWANLAGTEYLPIMGITDTTLSFKKHSYEQWFLKKY